MARPPARSPGPVDPLRSVPADALLAAATRAGAWAGVTRLADLTRLDRLGLPVWQAVRPLSRALSVHQGRGATDADARLGALLEAVESHAAETFDGDGPTCAFHALSAGERARTLSDFARPPAAPDPGRPRRWVEAHLLASDRALFVPFDSVSLDFTRGLPTDLDRASNGVATGLSRAEAVATALHELIERDAVTELRAAGLLACTAATLRLDTVPFDWFAEWRDRLARAGVAMRICLAPSLTGTPVFTCALDDPGKEGAPYRAIMGQGAHPSPGVALFKALSEAIQARATFIAGARDDLPAAEYRRRDAAVVVAMGLPLPAAMKGVEWGAVAPGPAGAGPVADALIRAGYPEIAAVDLAEVEGFTVVRAFALGLGSLVRRRRPAAP